MDLLQIKMNRREIQTIPQPEGRPSVFFSSFKRRKHTYE